MRVSFILKTENETNDSCHSQSDANWIQLQHTFFQTDHGGVCGRWRKNEHPASDEISNWQIDVATLSPSNALRKGVTNQGSKDGSQSIRHQPNEAHQYRPLFFGYTLKATMLVPPTDMPALPTLVMAPADK